MTTTVQQAFGRRVQQLRKFQKLTQEQFAEITGLSVDTISNIERGLSSTRLETMADIAKALKISLPELFEFEAVPGLPQHISKDTKLLLKLLDQCPKDQLPKLIAIVEQAINMAKN
jgi:transcriptional regulator with XRE-family HTH domain